MTTVWLLFAAIRPPLFTKRCCNGWPANSASAPGGRRANLFWISTICADGLPRRGFAGFHPLRKRNKRNAAIHTLLGYARRHLERAVFSGVGPAARPCTEK